MVHYIKNIFLGLLLAVFLPLSALAGEYFNPNDPEDVEKLKTILMESILWLRENTDLDTTKDYELATYFVEQEYLQNILYGKYTPTNHVEALIPEKGVIPDKFYTILFDKGAWSNPWFQNTVVHEMVHVYQDRPTNKRELACSEAEAYEIEARYAEQAPQGRDPAYEVSLVPAMNTSYCMFGMRHP